MGKISDVQIRHWIKAGTPLARAQGEIPGLTFTLSAKGTPAWVLRYRFGGKSREMSIGRYPDFTISTAKDAAREARAKIQQGIDVAREKQKIAIERAAAKTLRELAVDYMAKAFPRLSDATIKARTRHINNLIIPKIGSLSAREVTSTDIVNLIEVVGKKSVHVAGQVFTALSEIFKHGAARHVVLTNPCAGISVSAICGEAKPTRLRLKLSEQELRKILSGLPSIGTDNALAVKILLATAARIGELARAEWAHVDFDGTAKWTEQSGDPINATGPKWLIPVENVKTGKVSGKHFVVPLPPAVVGWFRELKPLACSSRFVLPARQLRRIHSHGGDANFEPRSLNAMLIKLVARINESDETVAVRRFTPHDLRSTARSHLAALGASIFVAERCLNHSLGGLAGIYDQHDYMDERRFALERWTDFIVACDTGVEFKQTSANVIDLLPQAA
jgi:integrase